MTVTMDQVKRADRKASGADALDRLKAAVERRAAKGLTGETLDSAQLLGVCKAAARATVRDATAHEVDALASELWERAWNRHGFLADNEWRVATEAVSREWLAHYARNLWRRSQVWRDVADGRTEAQRCEREGSKLASLDALRERGDGPISLRAEQDRERVRTASAGSEPQLAPVLIGADALRIAADAADLLLRDTGASERDTRALRDLLATGLDAEDRGAAKRLADSTGRPYGSVRNALSHATRMLARLEIEASEVVAAVRSAAAALRRLDVDTGPRERALLTDAQSAALSACESVKRTASRAPKRWTATPGSVYMGQQRAALPRADALEWRAGSALGRFHADRLHGPVTLG